jgi:RNA polymerase sigma-70 factor (ECF subfamily)
VADASLAGAWRQLRPAEREVLALALVEELTPAELAVALGVSINAATIRVHRAKKRLAALLAEKVPDAPERTAPEAT